jgi:hypothetical protein
VLGARRGVPGTASIGTAGWNQWGEGGERCTNAGAGKSSGRHITTWRQRGKRFGRTCREAVVRSAAIGC